MNKWETEAQGDDASYSRSLWKSAAEKGAGLTSRASQSSAVTRLFLPLGTCESDFTPVWFDCRYKAFYHCLMETGRERPLGLGIKVSGPLSLPHVYNAAGRIRLPSCFG